MLIVGWPIVIAPDIVTGPVRSGQNVNYGNSMAGWEARETIETGKNFVMTLAHVFQDTQSRVRDREVIEGMVKALSERHCELLQPLCKLFPSVADTGANSGDAKTICKSLITSFTHSFELPGDVGQEFLHCRTNSSSESGH